MPPNNMTSIHMDSQPQPANGSSLNQSQTSSKFDEVERVRQRMDGLRKHHNESTDIYNRTQPIINDQMHEETMKYLKNGQVNGTKTKSQKPRAPKRLRNAQSNNNTISPVIVQTNPIVTSTTNGLPPQPNQLQQNSVPTQSMVQQPGHMHQVTLYPPRIQQQQPMHMQHQQQHPHQMQTQAQQQHFEYQTNNNMYQQMQQTTMQAQHQYQTPQQQPQQSQPQHIYSQTMQPQTHVLPQKMEQNHFVHQHFAQHHNHLNGNHQTHHPHHNHQQSHLGQAPHTSLPNDLDLTLQAGLECDIDSLIKHEMSVEGQLDFNHDLLLKLDNHYQPHQ